MSDLPGTLIVVMSCWQGVLEIHTNHNNHLLFFCSVNWLKDKVVEIGKRNMKRSVIRNLWKAVGATVCQH